MSLLQIRHTVKLAREANLLFTRKAVRLGTNKIFEISNVLSSLLIYELIRSKILNPTAPMYIQHKNEKFEK